MARLGAFLALLSAYCQTTERCLGVRQDLTHAIASQTTARSRERGDQGSWHHRRYGRMGPGDQITKISRPFLE
jgi:hypothetical protein